MQAGLQAVGQAALDAVAHDDAVDHHLDVVLQLLVEGGDGVDLVERAVHLHPLEAALLVVLQLLAVLALAAAHHGRQE